MPPTRGHDLKRCVGLIPPDSQCDAPHTGARLETDYEVPKIINNI